MRPQTWPLKRVEASILTAKKTMFSMKILASVAIFANVAMAFSPAPLASYNRLSLRRAGMALE
jgi:hypothetical protein